MWEIFTFLLEDSSRRCKLDWSGLWYHDKGQVSAVEVLTFGVSYVVINVKHVECLNWHICVTGLHLRKLHGNVMSRGVVCAM